MFPAGPSFIRSTVRKHLQRSFEEDDEIHASHASHLASQGNGEEVLGPDFDGLGEEDEDKDTLAYDPKEWKKQDHYAVLGLHNLRYQANDDHIRVARQYRARTRLGIVLLARRVQLTEILVRSSWRLRPTKGAPTPPGQEGQLWRRQQRLVLQVHPEG